MSVSTSWNSTTDHPGGCSTRWVSAHLYYYDALDDLLRRAVRPLVSELATGGLIAGFFFVRYWQGGPHVRLRVLLGEQDQAQPVERLIETRVSQFFARCPSQASMRSEEYLGAAGRLAQHEFGQRTTTVEALQPNNSLRYVTYVPEQDRLGGPAGVAAFEPHFMDSAALALEVIAANPSVQQRTGRALTMMLLAAAVVISDLELLARYFRRSYRNWATRNVAGDLERYARYETHFQRHYQRQQAQLGGLTRRLLDQTRSGAGNHLDGISARWMGSVAALRDRLIDQRLSPGSLLFQCLHKHNNRLGIRTADEAYLMFLLQRTLTEITGGKDRNEQ